MRKVWNILDHAGDMTSIFLHETACFLQRYTVLIKTENMILNCCFNFPRQEMLWYGDLTNKTQQIFTVKMGGK